MEHRQIGSLRITAVGLGCNNFGMRIDEAQTRAVVHAALDCGVNFFDTADVYYSGTSERFLGEALGSRRGEAVIATKFGHQMSEIAEGKPVPIDGAKGGSARWVAEAVEGSLRRLGTDWIDLYQMHLPDPDVPIEETLHALYRLVEQGKVREIGCSNFSGAQIDEAAEASGRQGYPRFVSVQNHYSLLHRAPEQDVSHACARHQMALIPYFPLASGFLTGKYRRDEPLPHGTRLRLMSEFNPDRAERFLNEENWRILESLQGFCDQRGKTLLELAMSWLVAQASVASVIAGATTPDQILANAHSVEWSLSGEDLAEVDRITRRD